MKKAASTASAKASSSERAGAWGGVLASVVTAADLEALIDDRSAFIRIPRYLQPNWCEDILRRFFAGAGEERSYGPTRTRQLGLALAPMYREQESYFSQARGLTEALRAVYAGGIDPTLRLESEIGAALGWKILEPVEKGRPYVKDLIWALPPGSVAPIHCDASREGLGLFISRFQHQLSWNVYLSVSDEGGKLVLYRHRYSNADERYRVPGQPGYDPAVVAGVARVEVQPEQGDLILFDSDNYHEVLKTAGERYRITAHSFIGLDPARRELGFWS